jgi:hypothetical protein
MTVRRGPIIHRSNADEFVRFLGPRCGRRAATTAMRLWKHAGKRKTPPAGPAGFCSAVGVGSSPPSQSSNNHAGIPFQNILRDIGNGRLLMMARQWIHEINHEGIRLMARRDPVGIRLPDFFEQASRVSQC